MYSFKISQSLENRIRAISENKPGILKALESLSENPENRCKRTNRPNLGEFYINAGNSYALTFDIYEENSTIELRILIHQSFLHKLMIIDKDINEINSYFRSSK